MVRETKSGTLACNKYDVLLPDRPAMSVAVTLEASTCDSIPAAFGCSNRAEYCGLVFVSGLVDGPEHPLLWLVRGSTLLLAGRQDDRTLPDELRQVVGKLLGVFFREARELVPALSLRPLAIANESPEKV